MIKHIATVGVYVENQDEAIQFWTEKVGFELRANRPMGPNGNWVEVAPKGAESALVIYPKKMMTNWAELKPSIVFVCDNVHEMYEQMEKNGVKFVQKPNQMQWGTFAIFEDPDGNQFILKG